MMVLARKPNQSIMIGDEIEVKVIEVKGEQVKIGLVAPRDVKVFRSEIYEEIQNANKEAANTDVRSAGDIIKKLKIPYRREEK
jgi:carbon storage regulator